MENTIDNITPWEHNIAIETERKEFKMTYIEKTYGFASKTYGFKVAFDGKEVFYKQGAAADKFARKLAGDGKYCSLYALTNDGWEELATC